MKTKGRLAIPLVAAPLALAQALAADAGAEPDRWRFSLSGHTRLMHEGYDGLEFGLGGIEKDNWTHLRIQALGAFDYGETFRLVTELTWGRMWGKRSALAPPDEDEVDFLQLHAQARIPVGSDVLQLRLGRQTLYYGSGRLLASREGMNQRLAHDATVVSWQRGKHTRIDLFVASPVQIEPEAFDNSSEPDEFLFWSLYGVFPVSPGHFADLYYIGMRDRDSIFATKGGSEMRHTIGLRNWNDSGPFTYNTELIAQFGEVEDRQILAGAVSLEVAREFDRLPFKPRLGLRADAISGGGNNGTLHTFHPLFQANNYFNEAGFLAPSNLWNVNPLITFNPSKQLRVSLGVNFQWLFSTRDAIYGPPLQPLAQPDRGGSKYLGTAFNASVEWEFAESSTLFFGFTHHEAGRALTAIGGEDGTYLQAALRFAF